MRLLVVLVLATGCASATPTPSSPSAPAASAATLCPAPRMYEFVDDAADSDPSLRNEAMRVCVGQAERDEALADHWMARCGRRQEPEDPACHREHEAMFETLEMRGKRCTRIKRHTVALDDRGCKALADH